MPGIAQFIRRQLLFLRKTYLREPRFRFFRRVWRILAFLRFGLLMMNVPLPMYSMYSRGVRLVTGLVNARAVLPTALDLVANGALHPEDVTDDVVAWDEAADALMSKPQKLVFRR